MQIVVNDTELDFTLENEKTFGEIWSSLNDWVDSNESVILAATIERKDGQTEEVHLSVSGDATGTERELPDEDYQLDDVSRLSVLVEKKEELLLDTLAELDAYLDRVGAELYEKNGQLSYGEAKSLSEGFEWIEDVLGVLTRRLKSDHNAQSFAVAQNAFEKLSAWTSQLTHTFAADQADDGATMSFDTEILEFLRDLKMFSMLQVGLLAGRFGGGEEPKTVLNQFISEVDQVPAKLAEIGEQFSAGRDKEALDELGRFAAGLQVIVGSFWQASGHIGQEIDSITIDGTTFKEQFGKVVALLKELVAAMEDQDIVTLGDLLEYDLAELLPSLGSYAQEIVGRLE